MRFLLATGNLHKKKEVSDILSPLGYEIVTPRDLGLAFDPEETGATFEENALLKAREGLRLTGLGTIADDSGLCVEALQGRPGIYSARYGGEDLPFEQKIQLLLQELDGKTDRRAYFICAIACLLPDGREITVQGRCDGEISYAPFGANGFGYDPIFRVLGKGCTFAQLTEEEKNQISHRSRALAALEQKLKEELPL